ncbi:hypothetical protein ACA910_022355 [Epithemia clementina (nom. ined.)]
MSNNNVLSLPNEWDVDASSMEEELSDASSEESSKVFEQWQTEDQEQTWDFMDVDEKLGSDLLGDDFCFESCASPTTPLEELNYMTFDDDDLDRFSLSFLSNQADNKMTTSLPFSERYKATLQKLAESMERSRKTRKSLVMRTEHTEHYDRSPYISGVVKSIETSSHQLQTYLKQVESDQ